MNKQILIDHLQQSLDALQGDAPNRRQVAIELIAGLLNPLLNPAPGDHNPFDVLHAIVDDADGTGCDGAFVVSAELIECARSLVYPT